MHSTQKMTYFPKNASKNLDFVPREISKSQHFMFGSKFPIKMSNFFNLIRPKQLVSQATNYLNSAEYALVCSPQN